MKCWEERRRDTWILVLQTVTTDRGALAKQEVGFSFPNEKAKAQKGRGTFFLRLHSEAWASVSPGVLVPGPDVYTFAHGTAFPSSPWICITTFFFK